MKKENTETGNRTGEWKTRRRTGFLAAGLAAALLTFTGCGIFGYGYDDHIQVSRRCL